MMQEKKKKFKAKTLRKKQVAAAMGNMWKGEEVKKKRTRFVRPMNTDITQAVKDFNAYDFLCRQQEAKEWIEGCIGEKMEGSITNFIDQLRDGVILCKLANTFEPGSVPKIYANTKLDFQKTENINFFLKASTDAGLPRLYLFSIPDLWEKKQILNVIHCIHSLARYLESVGKAPKLVSLAGKVQFSQEELDAAEEELKKYEDNALKIPLPDAGDDELEEEADPDECTISGDGIERDIKAGKPAQFVIQARDSLGNDIERGGEDFTATITNVASGNTSSIDITDLGNGKYEANFRVTEAGESSLEVRLMGILIKGAPFSVNVTDTGKTDASRCVALGDRAHDAVAGSEASFIVQAKDKYGNNRREGGEAVTASLTTKASGADVPVSVEDLGDGTYKVTYTCSASGAHEMALALDGKAISGSPLQINVKDAGVSDPANCLVQNVDKEGVAGNHVHFTIVAHDKLNNLRESGGENFTAFVVHKETGTKYPAVIKDLNNGHYDATAAPELSGDYSIEVALNDETVPSVDASFSVSHASEVDPSQCTIEDLDSFKVAKAGETVTFKLQSRDRFGNAMSLAGAKYQVSLKHKESGDKVEAEVKDNADGTYDVTYTATKAGEYFLDAQCGKEEQVEIEDFDFEDDESDSEDLASSTDDNSSSLISPRESTSSDVAESITEPITEELTDKSADLMSAGGAEVYLPKKKTVTKVAYSPIKDSPATVEIVDADETDPSKTTVDGEGLTSAVSGMESEFRITSRDRYGNIRSRGGDGYKVKFIHVKTGQEFDAPVTDMSNGRYNVKFRPQEWGAYRMKVTLGNYVCLEDDDLLEFEVSRPVDVRGLSLDEVVKLSSFDLMKSLKADAEIDEDSLILEIQSLKRDVVLQIRQNSVREQNVKKLDRKIELLISNRVTLQEVLKDSKGFFSRMRKRKTVKKEESALSPQDKQKMELYANLFYILQTEPRYLARLVYLVSPDKVDSFLQTVILTLYGYAFSTREEYLLLSLFKMTLQNEIELTNTVQGFLEENPIITKMVMAYCRRDQGQIFIKDVLFGKLITPIIDDPELDMEINPSKILKNIITEEEIKTGVKSAIPLKNITDEHAMENEQVRAIVDDHLKKLQSACQKFLDGIYEHVDELPYGLRWVCKQLKEILRVKFADASDSSIDAVIGNFVYARFMNPIICAPDAFNLTKKLLNNVSRRNLLLIGKVLQNLFHRQEFHATGGDKCMMMMNDFIKHNAESISNLFGKVIKVEDPEEKLQYTKFSEFTSTTKPSITITPNEIFRTHKTLLDSKEKLVTSPEDPLLVILNKLEDVPPQVPEEDDDEINLVLANAFDTDIEKSELSPQQTYEETKELLRRILRNVPAERFGNTLEETLANAETYAKQGSLKPEVSKQLIAEIDQVKENLENIKGEVDASSDNFRDIIIDMAKDAHMRSQMREMQKKEIERLKRSLSELREHSKYLKEQFESYQKYLEDARMKQDLGNQGKKKKKKKSDDKKVFKFSYSQLEKKGVIVHLDLNKSQAKTLKFFLSQETPGIFEVEAKVAGLHVKTITIEIDDLLEKKYNGIDTIAVEGLISLDVNMTLHVINKLFTL